MQALTPLVHLGELPFAMDVCHLEDDFRLLIEELHLLVCLNLRNMEMFFKRMEHQIRVNFLFKFDVSREI